MPIHRDARQSRRRRMLRDGTDVEAQLRLNTGDSSARRSKKSEEPDQPARRSAGYSQDVRTACNQRLVQLIPVRIRSLVAVMAVCCAVPSLLMLAHYMVYVSGQWPWYGHPLALSLDASHPQGLAAWFCSHLWLLCLGTTLLTFQLRRHKLDDYRGEYRLWFWLVITCLLGSLDATTHLSQAFATAMDPACRRMLGWSGMAVMQSTLMVLIGMLGLRLCTELKVVPLSLCLWLIGLAAWAGSVALAREELRLEDMSLQFRIWARCALWLAGLASIWLAGLVYLRHVYIDAQRRFLLRGKLANSAMSVPISQRVRGAWESLPAIPRFKKASVEDEPSTEVRRPRRTVKTPAVATSGSPVAGEPVAHTHSAPLSAPLSAPPLLGSDSADEEPSSRSRGWGSRLFRRNNATVDVAEAATDGQNAERGKRIPRPAASDASKAASHKSVDDQRSSKRGWSWFRTAKDDDDAVEYHKLSAAERRASEPPTQVAVDDAVSEPAKGKRGWLPRIPRPSLGKLPKVGVPKVKVPKVSLPKVSLPKLKLLSFGLGGLRLKPPADDDASSGSPNPAGASAVGAGGQSGKSSSGLQPIDPRKPLPGTSSSAAQPPQRPVAQQSATNRQPERDEDEDDEGDYAQPMSKAERKRLKRQQQQQQNRAA